MGIKIGNVSVSQDTIAKVAKEAKITIPGGIALNGTNVTGFSKDVATNTRGINSDGTKQTGNQVKVTEASVNQNQPSTTPKKGVSVNTEADAYRYGNGTLADGVGDNLANTRVLGELDEETIAYLSISTEVDGNLSSYFSSLQKTSSALGKNAVVQGNVVTAYSRFFLQNVSENQAEKYQIVETFTSFYTFFYGKKPTVYSFVGTLLNDENHKWVNDFMFFYENFFRGTRTADVGAQAVMTYDGRVVSGFILDISIQQNSEMYKGAQFSMNMLVTEHVPVNFSADIATLIQQAQADLIAESARISQQISTINRNLPAEVVQAASAKVKGKEAMASVSTGNGKSRKATSKKKA